MCDGQRQRRIQIATVLLHQRRAPEYAVGIDDRRIKKAPGNRVLLQVVQIAGESDRCHEGHRYALQLFCPDQRRWQNAGAFGFVFAQCVLEYEAGDDIARNQRFGEATVAVECCAHFVEFVPYSRIAGDVARRQFGDYSFGRGFLGLGEQHIQAQYANAIVIEQAIDDGGKRVSRPRPLSEFGLAGLVDVDDDDTLIDSAGHRHSDADVVQIILDAIDELEAWACSDVQGKHGQSN